MFVDQDEDDGATPFGSVRGGYIPGAKHFWHKSFIDTNDYSMMPAN
jgi:hypothetical protein